MHLIHTICRHSPNFSSISMPPGQRCFSLQFCVCLRFIWGMWRFMAATNTYFLIVSVFEFSTTEWESELRKVIDCLESLSRTVGRTWLPNLQRFLGGCESKGALGKQVSTTVKCYGDDIFSMFWQVLTSRSSDSKVIPQADGDQSCICPVSPVKLFGGKDSALQVRESKSRQLRRWALRSDPLEFQLCHLLLDDPGQVK